MTKLLIVYGTIEGHTREIAEHIATVARSRGYSVELADTTTMPEPPVSQNTDAVVVCASVHWEKHQASVSDYVKNHLCAISHLPSAFVSSSLVAASPDPDDQAEAGRYIREFIEETGWVPDRTYSVAGALRYTQHDFLKRFIVRLIAKQKGGEADTSEDCIYTRWDEITALTKKFLDDVVQPRVSETAGAS